MREWIPELKATGVGRRAGENAMHESRGVLEQNRDETRREGGCKTGTMFVEKYATRFRAFVRGRYSWT